MKCNCVFFNKQNANCELDIVLTFDGMECEYNSNKFNMEGFKAEMQNYIIYLQKKVYEMEYVLDKSNTKEFLKAHIRYKNAFLKFFKLIE